MKKGDKVNIGPRLVVTLARRVAMIKGVGQVWRTSQNRFVMSTTDVCGRTTWGLVPNLHVVFVHFYGLGLWDDGRAEKINKFVKMYGGKEIKLTLTEWPGG